MQKIGILQIILMLSVVFGNDRKISFHDTSTSPNVIERTPDQSLRPMVILTRFVVPTIFGIIFVVGLLGNGLVIAVIIKNGHMRNSTNILISSLALADLTFILFCIPLTMDIYIRMGWIWGNFLCMMYQYLTSLTVYCSVYTLVLMSVDRYMAVVHPIISVNWRTRNRSILAVNILWIVLILLNLPFLLYSGVVYMTIKNPENNETVKRYFCTKKLIVYFNATQDGYVDDFKAMRYHNFSFFLFAFLIPLVIIVILYCLLLYRISQRLNNQQSANIIRTNKKVTRLVVSVIIAFGVSWLPLHIVFLIQAVFGDPKSVSFRSFHMVANSMAYGNSMINPILYAFLSDNFRAAFQKFLMFDNLKCNNIPMSESNIGTSINHRQETRIKCETKLPLFDPIK